MLKTTKHILYKWKRNSFNQRISVEVENWGLDQKAAFTAGFRTAGGVLVILIIFDREAAYQ